MDKDFKNLVIKQINETVANSLIQLAKKDDNSWDKDYLNEAKKVSSNEHTAESLNVCIYRIDKEKFIRRNPTMANALSRNIE